LRYYGFLFSLFSHSLQEKPVLRTVTKHTEIHLFRQHRFLSLTTFPEKFHPTPLFTASSNLSSPTSASSSVITSGGENLITDSPQPRSMMPCL